MAKIVNISKDFSPYPMGRDEEDGPDHGQRFYTNFLKPSLLKKEKITIIFDGVHAFGSSFLDEAFHEMPAKDRVPRSEFKELVSIVAKGHAFQFYKAMAENFIQKIPR